MLNNRVYAITNGSMGVAVGRSITAQATMGTPEVTGKLAWVQNTYASQYNHAVKCWESFDDTSRKRRMRGGHFLLYRLFVVAVVIVSFVPGGLSWQVKAYVTFPVVCTVLYLSLTIWNWHVFRTNGNLLHSHMIQVPKNVLPGYCNEFYTIPIYTEITDHQVLAISTYAGTAIGQLIEHNRDASSIEVMAYTDTYLRLIRFPKETLIHFIIFIIVFIVAIATVVRE